MGVRRAVTGVRGVLACCGLLAAAACTGHAAARSSAPNGTTTATGTSTTGAGVPATPEDDPACPRGPAVKGPLRDGTLVFDVREVQAPIGYIIGTHAEFDPKGTFVRVRLAVTNPDSTFHDVDTRAQRLADAADHVYEPSEDAMLIKRQPTTANLGAGNVLEFDVWFDVPKGTTPRTLLVQAPDGCRQGLILPVARP